MRLFLSELRKIWHPAVVAAVRAGKVYKTSYEGAEFEFAEEDILVSSSSLEGFVAQSDKGMTVVLDTNLTEELIEEGNERELVSKIQTMRKEAGFEVTDRNFRAGGKGYRKAV